jgi:hypothetical protein
MRPDGALGEQLVVVLGGLVVGPVVEAPAVGVGDPEAGHDQGVGVGAAAAERGEHGGGDVAVGALGGGPGAGADPEPERGEAGGCGLGVEGEVVVDLEPRHQAVFLPSGWQVREVLGLVKSWQFPQ